MALVSTLVQPSELYAATARADPDLVILDVTQLLDRKTNTVSPDRQRFESRRIPGSTFVDVGTRLAEPAVMNLRGDVLHNMLPSAARFAEEMRTLGINDASHVVLYSSRHVMWATRVWWMMHTSGFCGRVSVLDGGLDAWIAAGLQVESGPSAPASPASLPAEEPLPTRAWRPGAFVGAPRVLAAIDEPATLVIDTLKPASFAGTKASRYGRRGHIASAVNVPYPEVVCPDTGRFYEGGRIRDVLGAAGVALGSPAQPIVLY